MNKIIYIILINLILLNTVFNQQNKHKVADSKKQALIQAKSLEKSGLIKEATNIYLQLLNNKMYIDEAFIALKNIYINDKDYDALTNITDQY